MRTEKEIREYKEGIEKALEQANIDLSKELITPRICAIARDDLKHSLRTIKWVLNENN